MGTASAKLFLRTLQDADCEWGPLECKEFDSCDITNNMNTYAKYILAMKMQTKPTI